MSTEEESVGDGITACTSSVNNAGVSGGTYADWPVATNIGGTIGNCNVSASSMSRAVLAYSQLENDFEEVFEVVGFDVDKLHDRNLRVR